MADLAELIAGTVPIRRRIGAQLFGPQKRFVLDKRKRKAARCSRRAGKTQSEVRYLVLQALAAPNSLSAYFATTRESARKIIWDNPDGLPAYLRREKIPCEIRGDLSVRFQNGSIIWVSGVETLPDADHWAGFKFVLVLVDEAQFWPDHVLAYFLRVLSPTLLDSGGTLALCGTPHPACVGLFYEATKDGGAWPTHHWTCRDNPFVAGQVDAWVAEEFTANGLDELSPAYQRDVLGRWVRDGSALVYQYESPRNDFEGQLELPDAVNLLGIDLGFNDRFTVCASSFAPSSPNWYGREVRGERGLTVSKMASVIQDFDERYQPVAKVMDCGGLGKTIAESLREQYGWDIEPAVKTEKEAAIALFNDALRSGRARVDRKRCRPLVDEWQRLVWKTKLGSTKREEDPTLPNDYADAALYSFRKSQHWAHVPAPPKRPRNYYDPAEDAKRMRLAAEDRVSGRASASEVELLGEPKWLDDDLFPEG